MKSINSHFSSRYYSYLDFSDHDNHHLFTLFNAIGNYWNPYNDKPLKILVACNTQFLQSKMGLIASTLDLWRVQVFQNQFVHGRNFQLDLFALEALDNFQRFDYFLYLNESNNTKLRLYIWDNDFKGLIESDWKNITKLTSLKSGLTQLNEVEINFFKSSIVENLKKYFLLENTNNQNLKIAFLQDKKGAFSWKDIELNINFDLKTILSYDFFVKLTRIFWQKKFNTLIDSDFNIYSKTNKSFEKINWAESLFLIIYYYLFVLKTEKRILIISEIDFEFLAKMNEKIIYSNENPKYIDLDKFICLFVNINGEISFLPQTNLYKSNIIYSLLMLEILNYFASQQKNLLDLNRIISKWKPIPFVEVIHFQSTKSIMEIQYKILKINGIKTKQKEVKILENQDQVIEFEFQTANNKIFLVNSNIDKTFYVSIFVSNGNMKINKVIKKIKRILN